MAITMSLSNFDQLMAAADAVLSKEFGSDYELHLKNGSTQIFRAIFDTKLITKKNGTEQILKEVKHGLLEVLNSRIDKNLVVDAEVTTQLGPRRVIDVIYPDETSSALILTSLKEPQRIKTEYGF